MLVWMFLKSGSMLFSNNHPFTNETEKLIEWNCAVRYLGAVLWKNIQAWLTRRCASQQETVAQHRPDTDSQDGCQTPHQMAVLLGWCEFGCDL